MIHIFEIKLVKSDEYLGNKCLSDGWEDARDKLREISGESVGKLGKEGSTVFKTAILFIPIILKANETEKYPLKQKETSYIDDTINVNIETLVAHLKPKPDWIAYWLLPPDLQKEWQDENETYCNLPAVIILANLYEKWEKNESERWKKCRKAGDLKQPTFE